jgi:hypothetical protein
MDPEVQEQEDLAAKWQAAIDRMEAAGLTVEGGALTAPPINDPSLDPDILAALQVCIQAVNQQVSDGELALAEIGFDHGTGTGAGQPDNPPVVVAGNDSDGTGQGGTGEDGDQHA